jgi:mono/diheme cytochrome c family protein
MLAALTSCGSGHSTAPQKTATPQAGPSSFEVRGTRRIMRLPEAPSELPPGPGRETAIIHCGVCHTPNYIMNQPPFPRDTWIAEMTKMRKTFNAPIPDEKVDEIVAYLMSVRGSH